MQVNVTNETTTTTTTATTTTTIPTTTTTIEQNLNKEKEQSQAMGSEFETPIEQKAGINRSKEDEKEKNITATFTIKTPSSSAKIRPSSLIISAPKEMSPEDDEVSATFVMPPRIESRTPTPTTESVETTLVVQSTLMENSPTTDVVDRKSNKFLEADDSGKYSKSSTHNKENENNENKKTEAPPLAVADVTEMSAPQQETLKLTPTQRAQSSERIRAAFFNPLPLVTQSDTTTSATVINTTNSAANSTNTTPTLDSPVRLRDKRLLFDLDSASSQTSADKLRGEINKYNYDEKRVGIIVSDHSTLPIAEGDTSMCPERDTSCSPQLAAGYTSRRCLDSSSLPSSPLHTRDRETLVGNSETSATTCHTTGGPSGVGPAGVGGSFNNILSADRRPSWRLKFDSGSKVWFNTIQTHKHP